MTLKDSKLTNNKEPALRWFKREVGWCSGESIHLPLMWPEFDTINVWVEFVAVSRPCCKSFSMCLKDFLLPQNCTFKNSNLIWYPKTTSLSVITLLCITKHTANKQMKR